MTILTSINLFHSNKVDLAPASETSQEVPTLGKAEKCSVRLGLQGKLFSFNMGESVPIILSPTGSPYLYATSNGNDTVVFQDAYSGETAAVVKQTGNAFQIFSKDNMEVPIAQVIQDGKVLKVVSQGEATFTIHKIVQHPSKRFQTKYTIKQHGKQVASSRYGQTGNSYILTVNAGSDPCLITCLAAIADEIYSSRA